MRGSILVYAENKGLISGQDGKRYSFVRMDWQGQDEPSVGAEIDFAPDGDQAKQIFRMTQLPAQHSKLILAIICWFFGVLGVHRFMTGKVGSGVVMLILSLTVVGLVVSGIWAIVDLIVILMGNFTDKNGNPITA
jgi:TM2 domain-containing membrane protein YozV